MLGGDTCCYWHALCVPYAIIASCVGRVMLFKCYLHRTPCQYNDTTLLISFSHARDMSCALCMPTICTHDTISMMTSSMLHLRTTSLHNLITMIACLVASPMIHTCSFHWVDGIYVLASHMIYHDHCPLSPFVASLISTCSECKHAMLIDLGDLDILLVMHACLHELNVFGCTRIICFHTMPHSLVPSYDKNDDDTCWVSHHTNDWFCIHANLICFFDYLLCYFVL